MNPTLYLCLLFIVQLHFYKEISSFNLEPRIPVIKRGANGSYFGYSVAQHQSVDETTNEVTRDWLLVGAPLDQNLQPGTNRSGALWRCPMTSYTNDCDQVVTDGKKNIDSAELMRPLASEIKDDQWMGVTVRSQGPGRKVMVCAHRYGLRGPEFHHGQGLCYTLSQFLDYDSNWEPCKGSPVNGFHEDYALCQAGTSGMLLEDDTLIIGTPGPKTWRGTLYVIDVNENFLERDQTSYHGPVEETTSPVDKYSYLGMSVAGGRFLGPDMSYAAGAPRAKGHGQVVLFSKVKNNEKIMAVSLTLDGEQFASNFGYEMISVDVNGDKVPDLVVSAPFYFDEDSGGAVYVYLNDDEYCLDCRDPMRLTGKPESRFGFALANLGDLNKDGFNDVAIGAPYEEDGVVYIYLGSQKGLMNVPAQTIRSSELPLSRPDRIHTFGYSLSGGQDLDHNGYPDLLVGAYDSAAVVLLRARPIIGIVTEIRPERNLRNIDAGKPGCPSDPTSPYTCFSFNACCTIESAVRQRVDNLQLTYEIVAETFERKFSRVWFGPDSSSRSHFVRRSITLRPDANGTLHHCQEETVYVKETTRDIQSAIKFLLSYNLNQQSPLLERSSTDGSLPQINKFPILNQQEAAKAFQATFHTDCGENDVCESNVRVHAMLDLPLEEVARGKTHQLLLGKRTEVLLNVSISNDGESAYEAQLFVSYTQSLSYVSHKSQNKQLICTPFNATLVICSLGNPFKRGIAANLTLRFDPKGIENNESRLTFVVFSNSTSHEVKHKHPVRLHANVVRRAELSIKGTVQPDHVLYGGSVIGESAMKHTSDAGPQVLHAYHVFNDGPWKVASLEVHVDWPYQVANNKPQGKWLLYLEEKPTVDSLGGGECFTLPGDVNPLGLTRRPDVNEPPLEALTQPGGEPVTYQRQGDANVTGRRRRDAEVVVRAEEFTNKDGRKVETVKMDCLLGTAKCLRLRCVIFNLQAKHEAVIQIRARVWNSTLVSDYPRVDSVRIVSRARIHLDPGSNIRQSELDDLIHVETLAYPDLLDQIEKEAVPIWIIIVAVVVGLLLLLLLVLLLWKIGFFKRRRPDPTLSGNLEKSHREDSD